jgi:hypothetical protein
MMGIGRTGSGMRHSGRYAESLPTMDAAMGAAAAKRSPHSAAKRYVSIPPLEKPTMGWMMTSLLKNDRHFITLILFLRESLSQDSDSSSIDPKIRVSNA